MALAHAPRRWAAILPAVVALTTLLAATSPVWSGARAEASTSCEYTTATRVALARKILDTPRIGLATFHSSGVVDYATARHNIVQTANGYPARRSSYGTAPGGSVYLFRPMLCTLIKMSWNWSVRVSEIAGGSHSWGSYHYRGRAVDIDMVNGRLVRPGVYGVGTIMQICRNNGADLVLGPPNDSTHWNHIHCEWR